VILSAQNASMTGKEAITELKGALLIVRLDMKVNVQEAYEQIMKNSDPGSKSYEQSKERLGRIKDERERYKQNVIRSFGANYHFSDYCFIDNNKIDAFLDGDYSVLECPEQIDLKEINSHAVFFLVKGDRDSHWIFCDSSFRRLPASFPVEHDIGIKKLFDFIGGRDNFSIKNFDIVFSKMSDRLNKYYNRTEGQ
jgi:hypothetical protein